MSDVVQIIRDVPSHWVGDGFPVRSLFSYANGNGYDPFLLLDYAGPHEFSPGEVKRGVDQHPHRGFETVTIVYQGELSHGDSTGSRGSIGPGDVQWMTAGAGVVHEEFHSERFTREGGILEMVQLWVNLPAEHKHTPPRYQGITSETIPSLSLAGDSGTARVIAGKLLGVVGVAQTFTPINVWDVRLNQAAKCDLESPSGHTTLVVVQSGDARVNDVQVRATDLVELDRSGGPISITTDRGARLLVLTGQPIGEPVVGRGPFVMNSEEEIHEAIADFRAGRMGGV